MSDDSIMEVAKHVGGAGAGGGLMAAFMQWFRTKEAREARDALITLQGLVNRLVADVEKMTSVREDVVKAKASLDALHKRVDALEDAAKKKRR